MNSANFKLKTIGVNKTTESLNNLVFYCKDFVFAVGQKSIITIYNNNVDYFFELKSIKFFKNNIFLEGFVTMENSDVGRISFKYLP